LSTGCNGAWINNELRPGEVLTVALITMNKRRNIMIRPVQSHPVNRNFCMTAVAFATAAVVTLLPQVGMAQGFASGVDQTVGRHCTNSCEQRTEKIAVDSAGNAIAVWSEPVASGEPRIIFSRFDAATGVWLRSAPLHDDRGVEPQVAFDGSGNALAVWNRYIGEGTYALRYSRYIAGHGWTRPGNADLQTIPENHYNLVLSVGKNGDAIVHFAGRNFARYRVQFHAVTNTWTPYSNTYYGDAATAVDPAGNVLAVYVSPEPFGDSLQLIAQRYDASTRRWSNSRLLENFQPTYNMNGEPSFTATIQSLSVTLDVSGNGMVLWERAVKPLDGTMKREIRSVRYLSRNGAWHYKTLPKISTWKTRGSSMAADRFGNVVAVWNQYVGSYAKTVASRYSSTTGTWAAPQVISSGNYLTREPSVGTDAAGNAFATWSQRSDTGTQSSSAAVYRPTASRFHASSGKWSLPATVQDANRKGYRVHMGVDKHGRSVVMWTQESGRYLNGVPVKEIRADRLVGR
jgi:hypothetical protein